MTDIIPSMKHRNIRRLGLLAGSAMVTLTMAALPALAANSAENSKSELHSVRGKKLDDQTVRSLEVGENTERKS